MPGYPCGCITVQSTSTYCLNCPSTDLPPYQTVSISGLLPKGACTDVTGFNGTFQIAKYNPAPSTTLCLYRGIFPVTGPVCNLSGKTITHVAVTLGWVGDITRPIYYGQVALQAFQSSNINTTSDLIVDPLCRWNSYQYNSTYTASYASTTQVDCWKAFNGITSSHYYFKEPAPITGVNNLFSTLYVESST